MSVMKGPWSWLLAAIWLSFAAMAVLILEEDHSTGAVVIYGATLVVGGFCGLRALLSHVRITDQGLVYVGYARTHRVRWNHVAAVQISALDSPSPIESVGLVLRLADASELIMPALAGVAISGRNKRLERFQVKCNRHLTADDR